MKKYRSLVKLPFSIEIPPEHFSLQIEFRFLGQSLGTRFSMQQTRQIPFPN